MEVASDVRQQLRVKGDYFPIVSVLELVLPEVVPEFYFGSMAAEEMGGNHGLTIPAECCIYLREDVYEGVVEGRGRDRFTACHELGHLVLHDGVEARFHRSSSRLKPYLDSEWQANTFAGAILMPEDRLVKCKSLREVVERFGVSLPAAVAQNRILNDMGKMGILR